MKLSVVILCKNQLEYLKKSIPILLQQNIEDQYEIVVVDSGSTDKTIDFLKTQDIKLLQIKPEAFHFSKTFNWASSKCSGDILIRLSGDVIPVDKYFLKNLVKQFNDKSVVATYGKYILPKGSTKVLPFAWPEKRFDKKSTIYQVDPSKLIWFLVTNKKHFIELGNLAGGACAIRKDFFEKRPFNQNLIEAEDAEYAIYIHHQGYKIGYCADAEVFHEHEKQKLNIKTVKKLTLVYSVLIKEVTKLHLNYLTQTTTSKIKNNLKTLNIIKS